MYIPNIVVKVQVPTPGVGGDPLNVSIPWGSPWKPLTYIIDYKSCRNLSSELEFSFLILLARKLRPRKVKGHTVLQSCKWWCWDMSPAVLSPDSVLIPL